MSATKGGIKLRRGPKHAAMYKAQFIRTASNKVRRLRRRLAFDKTAQASINRILKSA